MLPDGRAGRRACAPRGHPGLGGDIMQTEFEFELPKGYVDPNGEIHKRGTMRLATAADEILPLRDPRVQQ